MEPCVYVCACLHASEYTRIPDSVLPFIYIWASSGTLLYTVCVHMGKVPICTAYRNSLSGCFHL